MLEASLDERQAMRIGELARRSGLSVDTIRTCERIGLMSKAARDRSDRRSYDERKLVEIDGEAGDQAEALADIAPDFARYLIGFPFGDIYCRPGLDLKSREVATIAALTAMGNATPHIEAGLTVGPTETEIVASSMRMAVHAGFPAALNGLFAARGDVVKQPA